MNMHAYMCMCICMFLCYMHVCEHVCICVFTYLCVHTEEYVWEHDMYRYVYMYLCVWIWNMYCTFLYVYYMCAYMYCEHAFMCVGICIYILHVCVNMPVWYTGVFLYVYVCEHVYVFLCVSCPCVYVCIWICLYKCIGVSRLYIYLYMYMNCVFLCVLCTYIHIHRHTHTYACINIWAWFHVCFVHVYSCMTKLFMVSHNTHTYSNQIGSPQ